MWINVLGSLGNKKVLNTSIYIQIKESSNVFDIIFIIGNYVVKYFKQGCQKDLKENVRK